MPSNQPCCSRSTSFVELALHVADRAGYSSVNELIVHTPCCSLATTPRIYRSPSRHR
ncbi:hypothetical protein OIO89_00025 (plasmid) [Mycobacterium ulcerans]|nr:hypothetical protein OIO89_00025 [Mycobacterium ulcerans]